MPYVGGNNSSYTYTYHPDEIGYFPFLSMPTALYQSTLRSYRRNLIRYFWLLFQVCRLQSDFWPSTCTTGVLKGDSYSGASKIKPDENWLKRWSFEYELYSGIFLYTNIRIRLIASKKKRHNFLIINIIRALSIYYFLLSNLIFFNR